MENSSNTLKGKKIILLGGSSGLGLSSAKAAAAEGAEIIIVSGNQTRIDQALKELPIGAKGFAVDLSQEENIKNFFNGIDSFDHLVYTAGENLNLTVLNETDLSATHQFFSIRYWGALAAVKYGSSKINTGGSISLIGGTANARPGKGWSIASSICGAIEGFVRAMAVELAPIRVNSVVPGVIKTSMWDSMPAADRDNLYQTMTDTLLLNRIGEAEDVALAYMYLMKQKFGTGQNIVVDGGTLLV